MSHFGPPTLAGFSAWVYNFMGVPTEALPPNSPVIAVAYQVALDVVNRAMACVVPDIYLLAVYNLGGDNLINFAPDQPNQCYFATLRSKWKINDFISGIVETASDESTSESMVVQKAAENFTLSDLQNLKTPYGRQYLAFAQRYGPSIWGMS